MLRNEPEPEPEPAAPATRAAATHGTEYLYDPAYDTLHFEMLAVLTLIEHSRTRLCWSCRRHAHRVAWRAYWRLLRPLNDESGDDDNRDSTLLKLRARIRRDLQSPSHVRAFWLPAPNNNDNTPHPSGFSIVTTAHPYDLTATPVLHALVARRIANPAAHAAMLDCPIQALSNRGDDAFNADQAMLWFALRGFYSLLDAIEGRSLAEHLHGHLSLLSALYRQRDRPIEPGARQWWCRKQLPEGHPDQTRCFDQPLPEGPCPPDTGVQNKRALDWAMRHMHPAVRELVKHKLAIRFHSSEFPAAAKETWDDYITVFRAMDHEMPLFRARLRHFRYNPGHKA